MPLVVLAPYFLFGMLHAQAVRTRADRGGLRDRRLVRRHQRPAALFRSVRHRVRLRDRRRDPLLVPARRAPQLPREAGAERIREPRQSDRNPQPSHVRRAHGALWQQAMREHVPLALLLVDLDHFKAFNDHSGHQAGDACLAKVASCCRPRRAGRSTWRHVTAAKNSPCCSTTCAATGSKRCAGSCTRALRGPLLEHPASAVGPLVTFSIGAACVEPMRDAIPKASSSSRTRRCTQPRNAAAIARSSWIASTRRSGPERSGPARARREAGVASIPLSALPAAGVSFGLVHTCGYHVLTADKVLVTIGTPCSVSAVGSTETYLARVTQAPEFIAFAAFDAGLIDIEPRAGRLATAALGRTASRRRSRRSSSVTAHSCARTSASATSTS